jgi:HAD superfamily hydrolase (TIGR01450 family)
MRETIGGSAISPRTLHFDGLVVDLDGVVWLGHEAVPGSISTLGELQARGVQLVFVTNDPVGSRGEYAVRLTEFGLDTSERQVVTSGSAVAELVREQEGAGKAAFVIGSPALKGEAERAGLEVRSGKAALAVDAVLVGGHPRFDYEELRLAAQAIRRGARLYAAGRDPTFPMPDGPWPATGAILAAVETAAGTRATIAGKPEPYMFDVARSLLRSCSRIAVVGDDLEADIGGGKRAGLATVLVLTGTTSRDDVRTAELEPDLALDDLPALLELYAATSG